jgi:hypothetical protein
MVDKVNIIQLKHVRVKDNRVDIYFSVEGKIQKYFHKSHHLFFEYNYNVSDIPISILTIPFVANIAPLAWITDSKLIVSELDQTFFECLNKVKQGYSNMFPKAKFKGDIQVGKVVNNTYKSEIAAVQLFSGGLDALATYIGIRELNPILITEYGWHENLILQKEEWEADKTHVVQFAKDQSLQHCFVDSNYGNFIFAQKIDSDFLRILGDSWWHGLHHSLAIISAAIPISFKLKAECIYIASSFFRGYAAKCASDPTIDNEIKFASGKVFHHGYEMNRQEKVKVVVDYAGLRNKYTKLRVCFKNQENCSKCEKCLRTIIGIIAEGEDPNKFGFNTAKNMSNDLIEFLSENVKFFNDSKIMQWELAKERMKLNQNNLLDKSFIEWFLKYNFKVEKRKALIKYRVTKFFPIIRRKIKQKLVSLVLPNN